MICKVTDKMKKVLIFSAVFFLLAFKHPFYLSVSDLKYNAHEKAIQGTVRLFVNDLESALKKSKGKTVDLINTNDTAQIKKTLNEYLVNHFSLKLNKQLKPFIVLGYEVEQESIWIYIEFRKCSLPKTVEIENTLLYDYIKSQTNIVHLEVKGKTKSLKVNCPESKMSFVFIDN